MKQSAWLTLGLYIGSMGLDYYRSYHRPSIRVLT